MEGTSGHEQAVHTIMKQMELHSAVVITFCISFEILEHHI